MRIVSFIVSGPIISFAQSAGSAPASNNLAEAPAFYRGINLNGPAVQIEGNRWLSFQEALSSGLTVTDVWLGDGPLPFTPIPSASSSVRTMLGSLLWRTNISNGEGFKLQQKLPNARYQVYVWTVENHANNYRNMDLRLEGVTVASGIGDLPFGTWRKYGPYAANVTDGTLNIDVLRKSKGDPSMSGIAIYTAGRSAPPPNQPPKISLAVPAATLTAPASLNLSATASDSDGSIAKVEFLVNGVVLGSVTKAPYQFAWNKVATGTYAISARATDNAAASTTTTPVTVTVKAPQPPDPAVRIIDSGARGDGVTDDASIIQHVIDSSPAGSTIDFGSGRTYIVGQTIDLRPNRVYIGASVLKSAPFAARGGAVARLLYGQSDNVRIDGLTFDANFLGAALRIAADGAASIPARTVTIQNCTFRNMRPGGDVWEAGIYNSVGMQDSLITKNKFVNCNTCIYLGSLNNVKITYNDLDTTEGGNGISVVNFDVPFAYGDGIEISYNTGRNFKRMAIEIFGGGGKHMNAPLISNNQFSNWHPAASGDPYGISVVTGSGARILDNVISGGRDGYAVELGSTGGVVKGNRISGFPYGIVIQGQADAVVEANQLDSQTEAAILFSNAGPNPRARVIGNVIRNPRLFGIGMYPNDYRGTIISGNTIQRAGGAFSGDGPGTWFIGIKLDAGLSAPVIVENNTITQTAEAPPSGFDFSAVAIFGGQSGGQFRGNRMDSRSRVSMFTGMVLWYTNHLDASVFASNQFIGFTDVTNGYTSSRIQASSNTACRVSRIDSNIISGTYCPY